MLYFAHPNRKKTSTVTIRLKKQSGPLAASLLAFAWIFFFFHDVVIHPNAHMFNEYGDGIKAFYVYADHIKNDVSYHQQRNMNYPYGQTFVFTDGQPAIANAVKFLSQLMPFLLTRSIAIYNCLILGSFILCAWFLALILRRFRLPALFVVLGAFCITALSSQIWRISGHPTMSYACFFPMAWYLLLRIVDSGFRWKWIFLTLLNTTFWFFVHPYLGMVITFFYGFYFLVKLAVDFRKKMFSLRMVLLWILILAAPVVLLKTYTALYDIHQYRSEYPWGFWVFYTAPGPIFLPHSGPFAPVFEYFFNHKSISWDMEKLNYVGLAIDAILVVMIFRLFRFMIRRRYSRFGVLIQDRALRDSMAAAIFTLLFAMCIPFKWGLQSMVDHIGFLRQFRALGRFGWAFYYVCTVYGVYSFYLVYRFLRTKKLSVLSNTLMVLFFSMFIIEGYPDIKERSKWAVMPKNLFNPGLLPEDLNSLIAEVNKQKESHQCIVTLPFFHVGTENFGVEFTDNNIKTSCMVSYWCNMPMMASSAARSPIIEGRNIMQFFSPGYISKDIQKDLSSKKDFLVLYNKEPLNDEEISVMEKSSKLFDNGKYELWSLSYKEAFRNNSKDYFNKFLALKDSLHVKGDFLVNNPEDTLYYQSYNSLKSEFAYKGKGALEVRKGDFTELFNVDGQLRSEVEYTLSFWYYNKGELRNQAVCVVEECDRDGNNCRWEITCDPRSSMVIDGDWSFVEKKFRLKEPGERIKIFIQGDERSNQKIFIDEFLLRPSETEVYSNSVEGSTSFLFYNNKWIKDPGQ